MKELSTNKLPVLVDDEDFERLSIFNWTNNRTTIARSEGEVNIYYSKNWKSKHISLANEIMHTRGILYDHRDRNYRNCQKYNLRVATPEQNSWNRSKIKGCASKYKGVSWYKRDNIWQAHIRCKKKLIYLGRFESEVDAAKRYDAAAKEFFGEFAVLNF